MFITKDKAFAVAVDYQERLMPAIRNNEEITEMSVKILNGLRMLNVDVFVTQQYTKGLGATIPEIWEAAGVTEHVEKIAFGAYGDLAKVIPPSTDKPFAIIMGVEAHICVMQTALGLKEAGYQPVLVTDCIGSRKKADLKTAIDRAKQEGIILATCESVLFELLHEAGTDTFRAISRLVK